MSKPDVYLSVIIPAYNEAERLPKTLRRFDEYFAAQAYSYEILVVNDGSRDNTAETVKKMAGEIKNLRLIDRGRNMGKGYSVREGMLATYGKIRLFAAERKTRCPEKCTQPKKSTPEAKVCINVFSG